MSSRTQSFIGIKYGQDGRSQSTPLLACRMLWTNVALNIIAKSSTLYWSSRKMGAQFFISIDISRVHAAPGEKWCPQPEESAMAVVVRGSLTPARETSRHGSGVDVEIS